MTSTVSGARIRSSLSRFSSTALLAIVIGTATGCVAPDVDSARRPNFLLIVADDLGYTDLGVFGGEIGTPNLDALARSGITFTDFYAASTCSPTRSMLLSGTDNHLAGLGTMAGDHVGGQFGAPGYETYLNFRVATLAELLQDSGYHTYMAGKWHLGVEPEHGPNARGFERSFALLEGGGGHFSDMGLFPPSVRYRQNGEAVALPADFYSTRTYTERMIASIEAQHGDGRPFLAYLAYTAPHWPLQAPDESIARFHGRYDAGYDALHASRIDALKSLGLIAPDTEVYPRLPGEPAWDELGEEQKAVEARKMEIYAAMVHDLDRHVGELVDYLKSIDEYENTFVLFLSDNGAEGHRLEETWESLRNWVAECCDNSFENMGRGDSYLDYGPNWARAGIGPSRMYKGFVNEGGIRVPAFASFPGRIEPGGYTDRFATVMDVMPTLLELAGVDHPGTRYRDREVLPMQGKSMWPFLSGSTTTIHGDDFVMGWELFGRRAIRQGDWKLVWTTEPYGPGDWELFQLGQDPAELHDLAQERPEITARMIELWDRYAEKNGVIWVDEVVPY